MIKKILISQEWINYIEKRNLWKQYQKSKLYLISWNFSSINFSIRQPKKDKIYYFRINKQFRVKWYLENQTFKVIEIDNHQNK